MGLLCDVTDSTCPPMYCFLQPGPVTLAALGAKGVMREGCLRVVGPRTHPALTPPNPSLLGRLASHSKVAPLVLAKVASYKVRLASCPRLIGPLGYLHFASLEAGPYSLSWLYGKIVLFVPGELTAANYPQVGSQGRRHRHPQGLEPNRPPQARPHLFPTSDQPPS